MYNLVCCVYVHVGKGEPGNKPAILFCVHDDFFPLYSTMQVCVLMSKLNDDVLPGEIQEATTKTIQFASKN